MSRVRQFGTLAAGIVLLAGFLAGIGYLFMLRFAVGDVFPPYSSLRSDPLGTKALYAGLRQLPQLTVTRNFEDPERIENGTGTTIFLNGFVPRRLDSVTPAFRTAVTRLAESGARLVFSFQPLGTKRPWWDTEESASPEAELKQPKDAAPDSDTAPQPDKADSPAADNGAMPEDRPKDRKDDPYFKQFRPVSLWTHWGLDFAVDSSFNPETNRARRVRGIAADLPEALVLNSALFFANTDKSWQTIYHRNDKPVLIRKAFGAGEVVLVADAYVLSNEALRAHRYPALLTWLVGPHRNLIFDEWHLDVMRNPGVAALMRKYRLHGLFWGLVVLTLFVIWQKTARIPVPDPRRHLQRGNRSGKDSMEGLVGLLRRNVAPRQILQTCYTQWRQAIEADLAVSKENRAAVQALMQSKDTARHGAGQAVQLYRRIHRMLSIAHTMKRNTK